MKILGIETSCDETSAAVVEETGDASRPWAIRSNVVASQATIHRPWGGVVPELASRQHIRDICGVVARAMGDAGDAGDLDAIAVTEGPGLSGRCSLACRSRNPPRRPRSYRWFSCTILPGISSRWCCTMANCRCRLWCSSYPAATPAFTSCGSLERINSSAGRATTLPAKRMTRSRSCSAWPSRRPVVDRLARTGNDRAIALPTTRLTHADRNAPHLKGDLDFSFSGLKTAVLRHVTAKKDAGHELSESRRPISARRSSGWSSPLSSTGRSTRRAGSGRPASASPAASPRTADCARNCASTARRARCRHSCPACRSTDNAAMIAAAGLRRFRAGVVAPADLNAHVALAVLTHEGPYRLPVVQHDEAPGICPHHRRDRPDRRGQRRAGRHRPDLGDAHQQPASM